MSKERIYRIEDVRGMGMYGHSTPGGLHNTERCPPPERDRILMKHFGGRRPGGEWRYAFENTKKLRSWVSHYAWRVRLFNQGLTIYVYEVEREDVVHGIAQSVFKRATAKRVAQIQLTEVHRYRE